MTKLTVNPILSSYSSATNINSNFQEVVEAVENTLSRDGSSPNQMEANIDMNGYSVINLRTPVSNSEAATKAYVDNLVGATEAGQDLSYALDRAHHTGVQAIATVTGLQDALDAKATAADYLSEADAATTYQPLSAVLTNTTASFLLADETKLDGIEALADVTDSTNVDAAGAIMHTDVASNGLVARTASETYTPRTITGTSNEITVTNGNAVSGNPTLSLPSALTFTGKTVTGGTLSGPTISGTVAGSPTFSGTPTFTGNVTLSNTNPTLNITETDAAADETKWKVSAFSGDLYVQTVTDAGAGGTNAVKIQRTGTAVDEIELNATVIDVNANVDVSGTLTNSSIYSLGGWTSSDTDIDPLINGSAFGTLLEGYTQGHVTVGIRDNDASDGFQVISGHSGSDSYITDNLYKKLAFEVKADGKAYIADTLDLGHASQNTLSASGGVLSIEGVAIPTISSTSTLTNKTISGGTLSGTIAGSPTLSGSVTLSNPIVGATPTLSTHLATKAYVDSVAVGLQPKTTVACATTANITLSGEQTIDGVLTSASRVLVKNQTTASQNGIYVSAAGSWTRATDLDAWTEAVGAIVPVSAGTTQANQSFVSTAVTGGTIGSTDLNFTTFVNTSGLQPLDSDLTAIAALTTASFGRNLLTMADASALRTAAGTVIGTDVQAYSAVLAGTTASFTSALETKLNGIEVAADATDTANVDLAGAVMHTDLASDGILVRTASETYASRTLTAPAAGITITDGNGVSGNPTLALANDLAAIEGLSSTGIAVRSASDTWVQRSIAGTSNEITATNGDGVSGNPTLSLPSSLTFTGKTVTGGTFSGPTLSGTVAGTPTFSGNLVFSGAPTFGSMSGSAIALTGAIDIGHATDTTLSRKSAGILQVESRQLSTVGNKVYRSSQHLANDGTTADATALASLVTTINASSSAVLVVDGLVRIDADTTISCPVIVEAGGFTVDSTKVLSITNTLSAPRIKIFNGSGTVTWNGSNSEVYPEWWGVSYAGTSSANLTAVNAMHASITAGDRGAVIKWTTKAHTFSGAWTAITKNNIRHVGAGGASLGTWFIFENTTGNDITFSNAQHCSVEYISFIYYAKKTSGYAIQFSGCSWSYIHNCTVYYGWNGFNIHNSTECVVVDCQFRNLAGTRGVYYSGSVGAGSYRLVIRNLLGATAPPIGSINDITKVKGNWATSTAYSQEDIVVANGRIWMCTTSGTSSGSGSGPSTLPGTTAPEQWTTAVTDGTAEWKFLWSSDLTWLNQDSYAYSLAVDRAALIYGAWGFQMTDSANTGTSYPIWAFFQGLEVDHPHWAGVNLDKGEGAYFSGSWMGSTLSGHGLRTTSSFRGEVSVSGSRIYANTNHGIYIACPGFVVTGNQIGDNGVASSGTYSGIAVAAGVSDFTITSNRIGDLVGVSGNYQKYGVEVATGASDNYIVTSNIMRGNVTSGLSDGGTGVNKVVTGNVV